MSDQTFQVLFQLNPGPDADTEELAELTQQLRERLLETGVDAVDYATSGTVPEGAKAGDPITWGMLITTLAASGGVLTTLIQAAQSWLSHQEERSVTLEIGDDKLEVTGISSEEQQRLVNAWLSRHRGIVMAND